MSDARANSTISLAQDRGGGRNLHTPGCRLAGLPEYLPSPGRAETQSGGVAPAGMALFLAILLAVGVRQWKEVHRKRDHAAVNPVKCNDFFLSIFS